MGFKHTISVLLSLLVAHVSSPPGFPRTRPNMHVHKISLSRSSFPGPCPFPGIEKRKCKSVSQTGRVRKRARRRERKWGEIVYVNVCLRVKKEKRGQESELLWQTEREGETRRERVWVRDRKGYSSILGNRNHGFWPSQPVSKQYF